jgi:hypothetical protein
MPMDVPYFHGHIGDSRLCHLDAVSRFRIGERAAEHRVIYIACRQTRALPHPMEHVSGAALEAAYGERASSSGTR